MIFHEIPPLAEDSHEIYHPLFFRKFRKMSSNLLSAAVMIGTLRVGGGGGGGGFGKQ